MSDTATVEDYNDNLEEKWNWLRDDSVASGAVQNWAGSENATLAEGLSQLGLVGSSGQISDIVVNMLAGVGDMISASLIITFFLIFMILTVTASITCCLSLATSLSRSSIPAALPPPY